MSGFSQSSVGNFTTLNVSGSIISTAPAGTPNFDSTLSKATVPASGSVQILGNQTALVIIREDTATGAYIVGILSTFGGNSILVTSGTFPNSTTPGASAYSFGYDGVNNVWKLYNGSGAGSRDFNLSVYRIK